jgi:hypothetical protein
MRLTLYNEQLYSLIVKSKVPLFLPCEKSIASSTFGIEFSRPEICHLVGEICADKSLKLLKKQLNGNFYSFTGH